MSDQSPAGSPGTQGLGAYPENNSVNFVSNIAVFRAYRPKRANGGDLMKRLNSVIAELEAARSFAVARFASEANMPVDDFLRHFRVVLENPTDEHEEVSFRVEPLDS